MGKLPEYHPNIMASQQSQPQPDLSQSYRPSLYAAAFITYFLATSAITLRFTARRLTRVHLWYDDWLAVVAWLGATAFFIDSLVWIHLGLGVHYQTIRASYLTIVRDTLLNLFVEEIFYSTATTFMKLSLLSLYWRIFNVPSIRWPVRILAGSVICWLFARYIAIILHCIPVSAYWDKTITNATCGVNDRLFFMGTNTVNFILDLIVLVLPLPYIQKLQVQRSQKLVVLGMFTLGGFIVAVSIILLVVCYRLDNTSPDVTWTICPIVLWAGTEINLGVVSACLPCLRPIFLLITKGSARPGGTEDSQQQKKNSYALKDRTVTTFASRGRNPKAFTRMDAEEDAAHIVDKRSPGEESRDRDESPDLEEVQPPRDKVMVREDIYVNYSSV